MIPYLIIWQIVSLLAAFVSDWIDEMGKRRGGKRKPMLKNGLGDIPIFLDLYRQMCKDAAGEKEFGYIDELCMEVFCKRMLEMFSHLPDKGQVMCSTPGEPWFEQLKADIDGVSKRFQFKIKEKVKNYNCFLYFFQSQLCTDEQIQQFLLAAFEKANKGEAFVRKYLFIYWMLKVENDIEFKEALKRVFKGNATMKDREVKLEQISNQFYVAEVRKQMRQGFFLQNCSCNQLI